jgi:hypothetical protein
MADHEAPLGGCIYPPRDDARYSGVVTVYYPLHPFFGRGELPVTQRYGIHDVDQVEVDVAGAAQALPVWMTDRERCDLMTMDHDPRCSCGSLLQLQSLIRSTGL